MTVVLVIMKMTGCPACVRLSSKLHTIENGMRNIKGLEDMSTVTFEVGAPGFDIRSVPYALRTVNSFPMMFLVPGQIWTTAMATPNSNIPLEGSSFMFNGEWVGSRPTFSPGPPKYSHNDAEAYVQWARDTMKERKFLRILDDKKYEAIPHRISEPVSSSSSSSSAPKVSSTCRIIRYTTKK
jgi:hypothetical protein